MRTTLNLPDQLILEAKRRALDDRTTLTQLIVQGLEKRLAGLPEARQLPVCKAAGGLLEGLEWGKWAQPGGQEEWFR